MAGLGATYSVAVEFGIRNRMAQGVRAIQAQMRAIQVQANGVSKQTQAHLQRIQQHATRYGTIWGNPKNFQEAQRNLTAIHRQQAKLRNQMTIAEGASRKAALSDQAKALQMTEREVKSKAQAFKLTEAGAVLQARTNVANQRSRYRMAMAEERERREAERSFRRRQQMFGNVAGGAFKAAEYSGIGAGVIGGTLFEAGKAAASQYQLAATTAMVLGLRGAQFRRATQQLMQSQLNTSMAVGMLSSADVAAVQTQIAMHVPGLGKRGLLALTPFVAKYADVMKMTLGQGVTESAKTAAMAANIFGARSPRAMRDFLNRFFILEQSTGVDQDTAVKALSQYGAMGKALGFSSQAMLDLYGQAFRLGAGGGKAGARLAAVMRGLAEIPTSVVKAYFMRDLGLVDAQGIPTVLKQRGQLRLEPFLRGLHNTYEESLKKYGTARGRALFVTGLYKSYGSAAGNMLFPLIQSGSLSAYEAQRKREARFYSIEQAQATFLHMPMAQYQRFLTNFKTALIEFGTYALPLFNQVFKQLANQMQGATQWMQAHPKAMQNVIRDAVRIGEALAAFSAFSFTAGAITKGVQAYLTVRRGIGLLSKAMGASSTVEGGMSNLATTFSAKGAAGLLATRLAVISGSIGVIATALAFLKGLQINAKMGTKGINSNVRHGVFGNSTAFPGSYNIFTGEAIHAPASTPLEIHNHVHLDGKEIGANKAVVSGVLGQMNRHTRHGIHSTTTGQGTRFISPIETLNMALQPKVY